MKNELDIDMAGQPKFLSSLAALRDTASLASLLGRVDGIRLEPLQAEGYSNASLLRVEVNTGEARRSLVLKRTRLEQDWTARRTEDRLGREVLLLMEEALTPVWDISPVPMWRVRPKLGRSGCCSTI